MGHESLTEPSGQSLHTQTKGDRGTDDQKKEEAERQEKKNALTGIARNVIPYGGWAGLRKAELVELLVETLQDDDLMRMVIDALNSQERAALGEVLAAGGHLPWDDFAARYGDDLEESPYWEWHQPQTLMGHLRARGVLVEAVVDGETQIVAPAELRPILRQML